MFGLPSNYLGVVKQHEVNEARQLLRRGNECVTGTLDSKACFFLVIKADWKLSR